MSPSTYTQAYGLCQGCCACHLQGGGLYLLNMLDNMTHASTITVRNKAV
jgi:hypothetical protein